jgi:hypothetical protein
VSFVEYYKFLTGHAPAHDIVPEPGRIPIAGKALDFPQNHGLTDATLEIWQINASGRRIGTVPAASITGIPASGRWGPVTVDAGTRYEIAVVRPGHVTLHYYYEPFVHSDYTLRILDSDALTAYSGARPGAESAAILRYKELWGDQGSQSDRLLLNGLNVCVPSICPISKQVNALFAFDVNRDGKSDLSSPDPALSQLPFITGADVFMPASSPGGTPTGTTSYQLVSRGAGPARTLNVPNWDSTTDGVVIQWNDFEEPSASALSAEAASAASCLKKHRFVYRIHRPHTGHIIRVTAFVDGHRVKRMHGKRIRRLKLPIPAGKTSFTVRIVTKSSRGQRTVSTRRYKLCARTRPRTRARKHGHRHGGHKH